MTAKLILLFALLAVAAVSVGAEKPRKASTVRNDIVEVLQEFTKFFSVAKEVYKRPYDTWKEAHRVRRQSAACLRDISNTYSARFQTCNGILQRFTSDNATISSSDVNSFCVVNQCPTYLTQLTNALVRDCEVDPPDPLALKLLSQLCYHGPGNQYCLTVWNDLHGQPGPASYSLCLQQFYGSRCPDSCKDAESWINSHLGCCYHAIVAVDEDEDNTSNVLTDRYWNACGNKPPTYCTN